MNHDLIERYIYAAVKPLPHKIRNDVSRELHGLIDDMLLERCGNMPPTDKDIRVVLAELGTPEEFSEKYNDNTQTALIPQPYYATYLLLLKIVLPVAAGGMALAHLIRYFVEPLDGLQALGEWFAAEVSGLGVAFTVLTAVFAVLAQKKVPLSERFMADELPPVPQKDAKIPRWECIGGMVFCAAFAVLFLFLPQLFFVIIDYGSRIPIFSAEGMAESWYLIVAFALFGILREAVKLKHGQYNKTVLTVTAICNFCSAALAIWWLLGGEVLNPDFLTAISSVFSSESAALVGLFEHFQFLFLAVILLALVLDTVEAIVKAHWQATEPHTN